MLSTDDLLENDSEQLFRSKINAAWSAWKALDENYMPDVSAKERTNIFPYDFSGWNQQERSFSRISRAGMSERAKVSIINCAKKFLVDDILIAQKEYLSALSKILLQLPRSGGHVDIPASSSGRVRRCGVSLPVMM